MKTKFSRRAKSAVSILLTLCMIFSVFTVAISSASAATVEYESVGDASYYYRGSLNSWGANELSSLGDNYYYYEVSGANSFKITNSNENYVPLVTSVSDYGDKSLTTEDDGYGSTNIKDSNSGTHYIMFFNSGSVVKVWAVSKNPSTYKYFKTWAQARISGSGQESRYGKVFFNNSEANWTGNIYLVIGHDTWLRVHKMTALGNTDLYYYNLTDSTGFDGAKYYTFFSTSSELSNNYPSGVSKEKKLYELMAAEESKITNVSTGYVLQSSSSVHFQNTSYTYSYKPTAAGSYQAFEFDQSTDAPNTYFNKTQTVNVYTNGATSTSGGSVSYSGYRLNSSGSIVSLSSSENSPVLTSEFTITATPETNYTFDGFYSDAALTQKITTGVTGNAYTYTVEDTKTVYANFVLLSDPVYCVVGNLLSYNAILVDQNNDGTFEEPTVTTPTSGNNWFNTWQDDLQIATPVAGEAGKYSFKIKVKDDYSWQGDDTVKLCIYLKDVGQKAYIYNNTPYNTAQDDITVPDEGISSGLYVYDTAELTAGGSLKLKAGQTYTITIDQKSYYQNNTSNPPGQITITTTDAFVNTYAKKLDYNATNRGYETSLSDAEASIGTVAAVPVHGPKGTLDSVITATLVNNNYTFIGWYTNEACTEGEILASACTHSGNDYSYTLNDVSASVKYYAKFKQNVPAGHAVAVTQATGGTITLSGGVASTTPPTTAYEGATVSMSCAVTRGYEFQGWKIVSTTSGADLTSSVIKSNTAAAGSFTMPASDVTVTATITAQTPVSILTSSNNTTLGDAPTYSETGTHYIGDTITITAAPTSGVFKSWQVSGGSVTSTTTSPTTFTITGSTVSIKAVYEYKTYELFSDKDVAGTARYERYPMIRYTDTADGNKIKYVSTRTVSKDTDSFTIYDVAAEKYAVPDTIDFSFNTGYMTRNNSQDWTTATNGKKFNINSDLGSNKYYVVFDPNVTPYGNVSVVSTNPLGTIAQIYAKDGSIRYRQGGSAGTDTSTNGASSGMLWDDPDWSNQDKDSDHHGRMTCLEGTTVITAINNNTVTYPDSKRYPGQYKTRTGTNTFSTTTTSEHLKIYSAPIGSTITIQTTVNSTYKAQGFYVGMFVVNGWKVPATDMGNGVYKANYTLSDEYDVQNISALGSQKTFEITPVYYNSNFEYVTFYVDAESVPSEWGNTISACADYNGTDYPHFEGSYPGQPLGREGDLYELKIAKYYYDYSGSSWTKHDTYYPSATITAYNYDSVHHYYYVKNDENVNRNTNKNLQTYDFADFAYLSKINDVEAILFRCKKETSKNHWTIFGKTDNQANYDAKDPSWYFVDDKLSSFNTWQVLTDYYGNPIDALGNRIVKSGSGDSATYYTADDVSSLTISSSDTNRIRIVSYGNRKTENSTHARTKAKWATGWAVYGCGQTSGTDYRIAYGTPADFICTTPGTSSTSNVQYMGTNDENSLKGKITFITYDKERTNKIDGVGDTGQRIDGQWYYSANHEFDSNVQVHITTAEGTSLTTTDTHVDADSSGSGTNDGWDGTTSHTTAKLDGNTTHTYNNVTTEASLNANLGTGYTFVGWYIYDGSSYIKIGDNYADLNTTMTMKKNYTIVAVVRAVGENALVITHSKYTGSKPEAHTGTGKYYVSAKITHNDSSVTNIPEAQNSITIDSLLATDTLEITLRTVCDGADTFYAWYEEALGTNYARTGDYYEICAENEDPLGESEVTYKFFAASGQYLQDRKTLDFYSDIMHVSKYAKLVYKYYDRFARNGKGQMVSYIVDNVELTTAEIEAGYIPTDEKISRYAPDVVDTIYTDTKWYIAGTKVERAASNITLMATQEVKDCFVKYIPYGSVGNLLQSLTTETAVDSGSLESYWTNMTVKYNSWVTNNKDANMERWSASDFIVKAPESYKYTSGDNSVTWNFVRFDVYPCNRITGEIGTTPITSFNNNIYGNRIYSDCVIYPVYTTDSSSTKELSAKLEPAVLNREIYGDSTSPTDLLYADLIISFINTKSIIGTDVMKEFGEFNTSTSTTTGDFNGTTYTVEAGVILDKSLRLSTADYNTLANRAKSGDPDTTSDVISSYNSEITYYDVVALARDNTAKDGLTKYKCSIPSMTNKNRLDRVFRYTNSTTSPVQKVVYIAYSYVVITNTSTGDKYVAISSAQKFNFAYTGNKPVETVSAS